MKREEERETDPFPRFSQGEYQRRFQLVKEMMGHEGVEALLVYGTCGASGPVHYLSHYLAWRPTWLIFPRSGEPTLFLHFYNHIPCTQALSIVQDVRCYWPSAPEAVAQELKRCGLGNARIGVIGLDLIPYGQFVRLKELLPEVRFQDLSRPFNQIRWVRSAEEIQWFRKSAELTDQACKLLEERIRPGLTEYDLSAIVHEAFLSRGGHMGIHFIATTPMARPERFVPWQFLTPRRLVPGDVVITEITITYWGYGSQIHRPFAVAAEPPPLYRRLFEVAYECFERVRSVLRPGSTSQEVIEAASIIEERGFTIYDSVVHGEGGKNPELGTRSSAHAPEAWTFQENQVMVIQPNPTTPDHKAGLQLGSAVRVTPQGGEPLQQYPFHFPVCG